MKHKLIIVFLAIFGILAAIVLAGRLNVKGKGEVTDGLAFTVTAYCPCEVCCGRFSDGITASGHIIQPGDKFAAAPPEVPYGTMLDIPGYGVVPVLDRGGSIKGNRLDVFFSDHETALKWGAQKLEVKFK